MKLKPYKTIYDHGNAYWMARLALSVYTKKKDSEVPDENSILEDLKNEDPEFQPASCIKFRLIHAFTARNTGLSGRSSVWLMFTASEDKPRAGFLNLVQSRTESVVKRM